MIGRGETGLDLEKYEMVGVFRHVVCVHYGVFVAEEHLAVFALQLGRTLLAELAQGGVHITEM